MTDGELRGWFFAVVALLLLNAARAFFPAYLGRKGQNLADKEDIASITRQIEEVKVNYSMLVEQFKAERAMLTERFKADHQLRMAAIDKRLQAHQEAFALWRKLMAGVHTDKVHDAVMECQSWWEKNCLYLGEEARNAFSMAYSSAGSHKMLLAGRADVSSIKESWKSIRGAGEVIVKGVALPGLTAAERLELEEEEASTPL